MVQHKYPPYYFPFVLLLLLIACNEAGAPKEKQLVLNPASIDEAVSLNITDHLVFAESHSGKLNDGIRLACFAAVKDYYSSTGTQPLWSSREKWNPITENLIRYISTAYLDGLYSEDYHLSEISKLKKMLDADSVKRMDAVLWTKADLLCTDAFMHILQDLAQGRLQPDSLGWHNNPDKYNSFFSLHLDKLKKGISIDTIFNSVQPVLKGYRDLKAGIRSFADSMDTKKYTYLSYPYKQGDKEDSVKFVKKLLLRLAESNIAEKKTDVDSLQLSALIRKYQSVKKINADGKITASLIRKLNATDVEKFNRVAVTLDRYKQLPSKMPVKYILVNLPAYQLQLWDADTVSVTSKIICGKPATATPIITSAISNLVIFPTWTVPASIIKKEMLPGLKKNAGYLSKKGLRLYNSKGELVDPYTVNWTKYSRGIPYMIRQGSGVDNALGVIKFNFNNPFEVYLHDTNQRYLFSRSMRALSHGCVRVQEWEKLAFYLVRNDSLQLSAADTMKYNTDSISTWIARKEMHRVELINKIPLFIRYFGCEAVDGRIRFYDDIYDEDRKVKDQFFINKQVSFK